MPKKVWIVALLALAAWAALLSRPARLRGIHVTNIAPGKPPVARIALDYAAGSRPVSVIVDLDGPKGRSSATINGFQTFAELPLATDLGSDYRIVATPSYRILGWLYTTVHVFKA